MLPLPLVCFYEKRKEVDREFIAVYYSVSFFENLPSMVFTPLSGPLTGDRNLLQP